MTLRKTTIDSSVRYISKDRHLHSEQTQPNSKRQRKRLPILNFHKTMKISLKR